MASLIDDLPGQMLPIAEVNSTLAEMWQVDTPDGEAPSEFRASQMNLILHFGRKVSPEEAREKFDIAVTFAQRYPCRILVLCPEFDPEAQERPLEAKLYTQCFIGKELREMCCVEVLMLAYYAGQNDFLENQVSVWLENDLPVYYWFIRMPTHRVKDRFMPFLKQCRRVVYDSSIEDDDYNALDWSDISTPHDLAHARMLPLRQGLGQYMSAISPEDIASGLKAVRIDYCPCMRGEARWMSHWFTEAARQCIEQTGGDPSALQSSLSPADCKDVAINLSCEYADDKYFHWRLGIGDGHAHVECHFGHGKSEHSMRTRLLAPEKALAEALFFE